MPLIYQAVLLFTFNLLDAILTIYWVRNGIVTEGNQLMATLLDIGDLPFLAVKIAVGAVTAVVLWRWRHKRIAKYGMALALCVYVSIMGIHFLTGLTALGVISHSFLNHLL